MSQSIDVGTVLGGRYKVTSSIVASQDGDLVLDGVDQVLNRPVSILVSGPSNADQLVQSAREVAMGERHGAVQVLDLGSSHGSTYLITNHTTPTDLLDLIVPQETPYIEPFFTDTLGSEIFGEERSREPETYDGHVDAGHPRDYIRYDEYRHDDGDSRRGAGAAGAAGTAGGAAAGAAAAAAHGPGSGAGGAIPPQPPAPPRSAGGGPGQSAAQGRATQAQPAYPGQPTQAQPAYPGQPTQAQPAYPGQPTQAQPAYPGQPTQAQPARRAAGGSSGADQTWSGGHGDSAAAAGAAAAAASPKVTPWPSAEGQGAAAAEPVPTAAAPVQPSPGRTGVPGGRSADRREPVQPARRPSSVFPLPPGPGSSRDEDLEDDEESRPRSVPWLVGGVLAVVLIAALIFAFTTLGSLFQPEGTGPQSQQNNGQSPQATGGATSSPSASTAPSGPPAIDSVTRLNPSELGFANEFDSKLPTTFDGNTATYWSEMEFAREDWGGFVRSVSLVVKLKDAAEIDQVTLLQSGGSGGNISVYTNSSPNLSGATLAGTTSFTGPQVSVPVANAPTAEYVIVQINSLPRLSAPKTQFGFGLRLAEIKVQ
ncbi:hypothetical protein [Sinomonas mesophila]|uniref:hypothetical protein n=1 Tax=Sinomonas mesophila TaxID=1531955 RepID=UPI000984C300|nr:hypothetical protein [Sinomonas mesophila]